MAITRHIQDLGLSSVLDTTETAHEQALTLAGLVAQAAAHADPGTSSNVPVPADLQAEISKQQKVLNTNLSHLRGQHRSAQFAARETKAQTAEARQEVDRLHLQLSNLYYEHGHLEGEIAACESFECVLGSYRVPVAGQYTSFQPDN